jgi:predicted acetyltransferase
MEIRPIKPEEKIIKSKIQSIAFMYSQDFSQAEKNPEAFGKDYETTRAAFDDNGKMCSCLELIPFTVQFDGHGVPMGGIGGVASLPEEREKRYIRHIFKAVMAEMYEKGYVFSYLYPFSHAYYRKFGYELNMRLRSYTIPLTALKAFEQRGKLSLITGRDDRGPIISVYERFITPLNLVVHRTKRLWDAFFEKDPYKDNVYLYLWSDTQGEPGGYVQFRPEKQPNQKCTLHVQELVWLNDTALSGILSFMSGLTAQAEQIVWRAPDFVELLPLFQEPYDIKQEILTFGMNRIVNAAKALEAMHVPMEGGEVTLEVRDDFFEPNNGIYTLTWEQGQKKVARSSKTPDMTCDVQTLSQLVTGFASPGLLKGFGRLKIHNNKDSIQKLFIPKRLYINNYF